jgi:hypothetical protein
MGANDCTVPLVGCQFRHKLVDTFAVIESKR